MLLSIQEKVTHFNSNLLYEMGNYFLDIQYIILCGVDNKIPVNQCLRSCFRVARASNGLRQANP